MRSTALYLNTRHKSKIRIGFLDFFYFQTSTVITILKHILFDNIKHVLSHLILYFKSGALLDSLFSNLKN